MSPPIKPERADGAAVAGPPGCCGLGVMLRCIGAADGAVAVGGGAE